MNTSLTRCRLLSRSSETMSPSDRGGACTAGSRCGWLDGSGVNGPGEYRNEMLLQSKLLFLKMCWSGRVALFMCRWRWRNSDLDARPKNPDRVHHIASTPAIAISALLYLRTRYRILTSDSFGGIMILLTPKGNALGKANREGWVTMVSERNQSTECFKC